MSNIHDVKTMEEFVKVAGAAEGQVLIDFHAPGCGPCEDQAPEVVKLAEGCPSATVIRVNVEEASDLADAFNVDGTPTLLVAATGAEATPGAAKEVGDVAEARKKMKCAR